MPAPSRRRATRGSPRRSGRIGGSAAHRSGLRGRRPDCREASRWSCRRRYRGRDGGGCRRPRSRPTSRRRNRASPSSASQSRPRSTAPAGPSPVGSATRALRLPHSSNLPSVTTARLLASTRPVVVRQSRRASRAAGVVGLMAFPSVRSIAENGFSAAVKQCAGGSFPTPGRGGDAGVSVYPRTRLEEGPREASAVSLPVDGTGTGSASRPPLGVAGSSARARIEP